MLHLMSVGSGFPGVVFWDAPIHHCITSQGATIQSPHTGISLSIPEQALSSTEKDVDLLIHSCLNGPFELPAGYKSASPAYLIQPSSRVKFHRDAILRIHHHASLQSEEDCEEMAFLSASPTPQYRQSKPVYIFEEIKHCQGSFRPNSQVGEIRLQHFCFTKIGRKRKGNPQSRSSASKKSKCVDYINYYYEVYSIFHRRHQHLLFSTTLSGNLTTRPLGHQSRVLYVPLPPTVHEGTS